MSYVLLTRPARVAHHGGFWRSQQLFEALSARFPLNVWEAKPGRTGLTRFRPGHAVSIAAQWRRTCVRLPRAFPRVAIAAALRRGPLLDKLREWGEPIGAVLEDYRLLFDLPSRIPCRVAVPQNVESLASAADGDGMQLELTAYRACDLVCTISAEEAWFLRNLGVNAVWWPYFPPDARRHWLAQIAAARRSTTKRHYLALGSTVNPPTARGMAQLMRCWPTKAGRGNQLVVAGVGSERLKGECSGPVQVAGEVDDDRLAQLLTEAHAVLAYQQTGAGALTRIVDCAIAGVPVIANEHASRSAPQWEGLRVGATLDEMIDFCVDQADDVQQWDCATWAERQECTLDLLENRIGCGTDA